MMIDMLENIEMIEKEELYMSSQQSADFLKIKEEAERFSKELTLVVDFFQKYFSKYHEQSTNLSQIHSTSSDSDPEGIYLLTL